MMERQVVPLPPPRWRKAIPVKVKLNVVIRQEGKCAMTGEKLGSIENTQFDHRPPLHEREYVAAIDDTIPPANDPDYIFAVLAEPHREESKKDKSRMSKVDRLRRETAEHDDAVATKQKRRKGSIQSRGFPKIHRPMRGRATR